MDDGIIVKNDLAERYALTLPTGSGRSEAALAREATTPGTIDHYLLNDAKLSTMTIKSLVRAGRTVEAYDLYKERNERIDVNMDAMLSAANMERRGALSEAVGGAATSEVRRDFNDEDVQTQSGETFKMGAFFADERLWKSTENNDPGHSYRSQGYSARAVNALLAGRTPDGPADGPADESLKRAMGYFMKTPGTSPAARRAGFTSALATVQDTDAADALVDNWADMVDVFGAGGAERFAQRVALSSRGAAAAPKVAPLLDLARAHRASTNLSGERLVASLFSAYQGMQQVGAQSDPDPDTGSRARPVSQDKLMFMDAVQMDMLTQLERTGGGAYVNALSNPLVADGLNKAMDILAACTASGIDLQKSYLEDGRSVVKAVAADLAERARTGREPANGFIAMYRRFDERLKGQITGARDFQRHDLRPAADLRDHQKTSRLAGGQSSRPTIDVLAGRINQTLLKSVAPLMDPDKDIDAGAAWRKINGDPVLGTRRYDDLVKLLTREAFVGKGAEDAARFLAGQVIDAMENNAPLCIEETLVRAAGDRKFAAENPEAYASIRNWVYANTDLVGRYAEKLAQLSNFWATEEGGRLSESERHVLMARVLARAGALDRASASQTPDGAEVGLAAAAYLDQCLNQGFVIEGVPRHQTDTEGKEIPNGKVIGYTWDRKPSFDLDTDSERILRERYELEGGRRAHPDIWLQYTEQASEQLRRQQQMDVYQQKRDVLDESRRVAAAEAEAARIRREERANTEFNRRQQVREQAKKQSQGPEY